MPRQVVKFPQARVYDKDNKRVDSGRIGTVVDKPEGGRVSYESGLEILWGHNAPTIEVGVTLHESEIRDWLRRIDEGEVVNDYGVFTHFVSINRSQANDIISTTRRARNAAFGEDQ